MRGLALLLAGCTYVTNYYGADAAPPDLVQSERPVGTGGPDLSSSDLAQNNDLARAVAPDLAHDPDLASAPPDLGQSTDFAGCGIAGGPCCAGMTCTQSDTVCRQIAPGQAFICRNCGYTGEPCCAGGLCFPGQGTCAGSGGGACG